MSVSLFFSQYWHCSPEYKSVRSCLSYAKSFSLRKCGNNLLIVNSQILCIVKFRKKSKHNLIFFFCPIIVAEIVHYFWSIVRCTLKDSNCFISFKFEKKSFSTIDCFMFFSLLLAINFCKIWCYLYCFLFKYFKQ